MRYRAQDVYAHLRGLGCEFDGERYPHGEIWIAPNGHVFVLPDPDRTDGDLWLDAEVLDDNLKDRWLGHPLPLKRYP